MPKTIVSFQDLRLFRVNASGDAAVCNNEKLISGSTDAYVASSRMFLLKTLFKDAELWPTAILAPSNLVDKNSSQNNAITVSAISNAARGKNVCEIKMP